MGRSVCVCVCWFVFIDAYVVRENFIVDGGNSRVSTKSSNRQSSETLERAQDGGGQWKHCTQDLPTLECHRMTEHLAFAVLSCLGVGVACYYSTT